MYYVQPILKESQVKEAEKLLNCTRYDPIKSIKKKYKTLVKVWHSDRVGENDTIKRVNNAFLTIKRFKNNDPVKNDTLNSDFSENTNESWRKYQSSWQNTKDSTSTEDVYDDLKKKEEEPSVFELIIAVIIFIAIIIIVILGLIYAIGFVIDLFPSQPPQKTNYVAPDIRNISQKKITKPKVKIKVKKITFKNFNWKLMLHKYIVIKTKGGSDLYIYNKSKRNIKVKCVIQNIIEQSERTMFIKILVSFKKIKLKPIYNRHRIFQIAYYILDNEDLIQGFHFYDNLQNKSFEAYRVFKKEIELKRKNNEK